MNVLHAPKRQQPPTWGRTARFRDPGVNPPAAAVPQQMVRVSAAPARDYSVYLGPTIKHNAALAGDIIYGREQYRVNFGTGGASFGPLVIRTSVRGTVVHVAAETIEVVCEHQYGGAGFAGVYEAQASLAVGRAVDSWVSASETAPRPTDPLETLVRIPMWATHVQYVNTDYAAPSVIRQLRENGNVLSATLVTTANANPVLLHEEAFYVDAFGAPTPSYQLRDFIFRILF